MACDLAGGAKPEIVHINQLLSGARRWPWLIIRCW